MTVEEMMGALSDMGLVRMRAGRRAPSGMVRTTRSTPIRARPAVISATPGVPPVAEKRMYLGLGDVTFTNTSAQLLTLTGNTFVPFRGGRVTLVVLRSAGAAAIGIRIVALLVGNVPQNAGTGLAPADAYGPLATDGSGSLMITGAGPGIPVTVQLSSTATPAAGETVNVSGQVVGEGIGQ